MLVRINLQNAFLLLVAIILTMMIAFLRPATANPVLYDSFQHQRYSKSELELLQTALAFKGHYRGLIDGEWGRKSEQAIQSFSRERFEASTSNWHTAILAIDFADAKKKNGWQFQYFETLGLAFFLPKSSASDGTQSEKFFNFEHTRSSLAYSVAVTNKKEAQNFCNCLKSKL